jgi:hypothetical protein
MAQLEIHARPVWLYRYRSLGTALPINQREVKLNREISAIESNAIYCARYDQLNDPMEGFYRASKKTRASEKYASIVDAISDEKFGNGIASFSEAWDSALMWAHYSNNFHGICICYSLNQLLATTDEECSLSRMAYGHKAHYLNLPAAKNEPERARAVLSAKHSAWHYEREWRLFAPRSGLVTHGSAAIKSVFLGARMADSVRASIVPRLDRAGIKINETIIDGYNITKRALKT